MKIEITVKTNARKVAVEPQPDGSYRVMVNAPPIEGRANEAVRDALAEHFKVPRSKVRLVHGERSKRKVFELEGR